MPGEFLGHDEVDVAAAEAGDEEDAVGVKVGDAIGGRGFREYLLQAEANSPPLAVKGLFTGPAGVVGLS